MVRTLREELGTKHGTVKRVAEQLGYGPESVRAWVRQADIDDGLRPGTTSVEAERLKALEQENRELRRANEILMAAASFFSNPGVAAEFSTANRRGSGVHRRPQGPGGFLWASVGSRAHLPYVAGGSQHLLRR